MTPYVKIFAILALLLLLSCALLSCAGEGDPITYNGQEHTHVYGHWYDAAPETEGGAVTHEVRYCKICHAEDVRVKE